MARASKRQSRLLENGGPVRMRHDSGPRAVASAERKLPEI
jgi:hypothetical protein